MHKCVINIIFTKRQTDRQTADKDNCREFTHAHSHVTYMYISKTIGPKGIVYPTTHTGKANTDKHNYG